MAAVHATMQQRVSEEAYTFQRFYKHICKEQVAAPQGL